MAHLIKCKCERADAQLAYISLYSFNGPVSVHLRNCNLSTLLRYGGFEILHDASGPSGGSCHVISKANEVIMVLQQKHGSLEPAISLAPYQNNYKGLSCFTHGGYVKPYPPPAHRSHIRRFTDEHATNQQSHGHVLAMLCWLTLAERIMQVRDQEFLEHATGRLTLWLIRFYHQAVDDP